MAMHERDQKLRRITRIVIYFVLIAFFLILFVMISRWSGREQEEQEPVNTSITVGSLQSPVGRVTRTL